MQGHFYGANAAPTSQETWEQYDQFADLGLKVAITEYDAFAGGWDTIVPGASPDEAKGLFFESILRTTFAHPAATGFTMWGFWDGAHWKNQAGLFFEDWSSKPSHQVWRRLIFDEWQSSPTVTTGQSGTANARLFHGRYRVTIRAGVEEWSFIDYVTPGVTELYYGLPEDKAFEQLTPEDLPGRGGEDG